MSFKLITMHEPIWGQKLIVFLNNYINTHVSLSHIVPITSDIFVFTYPIYITLLYLYGIGKKQDIYKEFALYVFFSGVSSVLLNLFIQLFIDKDRPESVLDKSKLLLDHIPDASFPSDHAAMSAAIAMAIMLWGIKHKNKTIFNISLIFWSFCVIMSISRVAVGVHWPTDILFGIIVGVFVSYLLISQKVYGLLNKYIFKYIIIIEKFIMKKIFKIDQE